jgi:hypothetical protein
MCIALLPGIGKPDQVLVFAEIKSDQGDPGAKRRKAWLILIKWIRVLEVLYMHFMKEFYSPRKDEI